MIRSLIAMTMITVAGTQCLANKISAEEMQANYETCAASDPSWMSRWGQYVVAYDLRQAYDLCRKKAWPSSKVTALRMGCKANGEFIVAGYYCQSL